MYETTCFLLLLFLSSFRRALSTSAADFVLNFGKYSGKSLKEVPQNYIQWMIKEKVYLGKPELMKALTDMKRLDPAPSQVPAMARNEGNYKFPSSQQPRHPTADRRDQQERPSSVRLAPGTIDFYMQKNNTNVEGIYQRNGTESPPPSLTSTRLYFSLELVSPHQFSLRCSGVGAEGLRIALPKLATLLRSFPRAFFNMTSRSWYVHVEDYDAVVKFLCELGYKPGKEHDVDTLPRFLLSYLRSRPQLLADADVEEAYSALPSLLKSSLLPFQRDGVRFALKRKGRVLIGDEMGLGKTLQALAVAAAYKREWPLLIICPSSLRLNWAQECSRWLEGMKEEPLEVQVVMKGSDAIKGVDVTIVSYDLATRMSDAIKASSFKVVIADESHYIKTDKALRTRACMPLLRQASRAILLSGTPALSRPVELLSQLQCLQPKIFSSKREFQRRYCNAKQGRWGLDTSGASCLQELSILLSSSVMIRRLKREVLVELPAKRRQKVFINVANKDLKKIQSIMNRIDSVDMRPSSSPPAGHAGDEKEQVGENGGERKRRRGSMLDSLITEAYLETGLAKLPEVCSYLADLIEGGCKFLVFAHHLQVLDGIERFLLRSSVKYIRIDGSVPPAARAERVKMFQEEEEVRVGVLGMTAAGTGLTLTSAATVVFAELYWTPGVMMQAEDRVHRISQQLPVNIHYLLARGTADELVWSSIVSKVKIVSWALDGSQQAVGGWLPERGTPGGSERVKLGESGGKGDQLDLVSFFSQQSSQVERAWTATYNPSRMRQGSSSPGGSGQGGGVDGGGAAAGGQARSAGESGEEGEVGESQAVGGEGGGGNGGSMSAKEALENFYGDQEVEHPADFLCPISMEVMKDPVIAMDGHSYERQNIERWLEDHNTSPLTNQKLSNKMVVPNHRLKAIISNYLEKARQPV